MNKSIIPNKRPEEEELDRKLTQLESLKIELVQHELELTTLQADLHSFELQYLKIVGVKIAELDDVMAQIAEVFAKTQRGDETVQNEAKEFRSKANESAESVGAAQVSQESQNRFTYSDNIKSLFREAAKHIHPDFANDENDRIRRTKLMAEINEAYRAGDENRLRQILKEWEDSPENIVGDDVGAKLIRTIRQIAHIQERMSGMEAEINALMETAIYRLKVKIESANTEISKVLEDMASKLDEQISEQQERLIKLIDVYVNSKSKE
jgi:hypothetical protein